MHETKDDLKILAEAQNPVVKFFDPINLFINTILHHQSPPPIQIQPLSLWYPHHHRRWRITMEQPRQWCRKEDGTDRTGGCTFATTIFDDSARSGCLRSDGRHVSIDRHWAGGCLSTGSFCGSSGPVPRTGCRI